MNNSLQGSGVPLDIVVMVLDDETIENMSRAAERIRRTLVEGLARSLKFEDNVITYRRASSDAIAEVRYKPEFNALRIEFKSGGRYVYFGVPTLIYFSFILSESLGSYFRRFISGKYESVRL